MRNREALESYLYLENRESICIGYSERYVVLSQALDRLEELEEENKKLKEKVKELKEELKEELEIAIKNYKCLVWHNNNQYNLLIKYNKCIEILKRKKVNIFSIQLLTCEQYNKSVVKEDELTEEEYELLKEVLGDDE